jgi:hypothetical protein
VNLSETLCPSDNPVVKNHMYLYPATQEVTTVLCRTRPGSRQTALCCQKSHPETVGQLL